jgi:hypothetical protein
MNWKPYEDGRSIGETGSERGTIVRDEEHADGARITLEEAGTAPFAITCGIYGVMVHTAFFSSRQEAENAFETMRNELDEIMKLDGDTLYTRAEAFLDKWWCR